MKTIICLTNFNKMYYYTKFWFMDVKETHYVCALIINLFEN